MNMEELQQLNDNQRLNLFIPIINSVYNSNISVGSSCFGEGYVEPKYLNYTVKKGDNLS